MLRNETTTIPFFAHNFSGFDGHFLIKNIPDDSRIKRVNMLPLNSEKFRTLSINNFLFLDSMAFLNASLDTLVVNLSHNYNFPILSQIEHDDKKKQLLCRKGVFPYEYITSVDILKEENLPSRENFYSKLSNSHISEEDYSHAQKVFSTFKCSSIQEYSELYCQTDVILLAEVMLRFRNQMMQEVGLDVFRYIRLVKL